MVWWKVAGSLNRFERDISLTVNTCGWFPFTSLTMFSALSRKSKVQGLK